ncbi:ABC transporter substrate-binding protein [Kiloniella laminariae]|uniref:ABC transporter substrate-binding protein n=1 Tax=Kiloniella laminariae TaxID=454162 RepID=A0ABT4LGJ3_9PROT|nr:ABC transporter substrate-binding protein [Kiloniella laminariae]MCZ4280214.1 ABC transporter substrate-binding protein [Kiloniella laminariae]
MKTKQFAFGIAVATACALTGTPSQAAEKLNVLCAADDQWCNLMESTFEKETGVDVSMVRKSSGEIFAQIKAESRNPKVDIWWGGTGDPHLQAAAEDLTVEYKSPQLDSLLDWAKNQAKDGSYKTVGIYAGALGIGYNEELLKSKGLPAPKCWADLTNPAYKGEIQMANPNSSGTAYTTLATVVQLFGEEKGFEFLAGLHGNINQYTKSGSAPIKAAARGETTLAITFMHDMVKQVKKGFPIKVVAPCEGTGYEVGSMSIVKGARNPETAQKFAEFALRADIQSLAADAEAYQVPSNASATVPDEAPKLSDLKLIEYDFATYGSSDTRKRLLKRWDDEIKSLPR